MKDPKALPPIPTPFSTVWREVRIRVVPIVMFFVTIAAAVFVWSKVPMGGNLRGVGEGARSVVTSPRAGVLQRLQVQPFQWVEAGDPLVTIMPVDPGAQLDLLQSELQLTRLRMEPSVADQNALNFEQVRVDWLRLKQELAMAKVNLGQAETLLARNEKLVKEKLVSEDLYDLSLRDRNLYEAEVKELTASMQSIEQRLSELRGVGEPQSPGTNQGTFSIIARLEARMATVETNWSPVTLLAPISGRVHMISRQENEFVVEGEQLVVIASPQSERIVAYMRQPFGFEPKPGMTMEVLMQNQQRLKFSTQIVEVGAQLEAITNALAFLQTGALVDMGLPVILEVPRNVQLRPGEMVSIMLPSGPLNFFRRNPANSGDRSKPLVQVRP